MAKIFRAYQNPGTAKQAVPRYQIYIDNKMNCAVPAMAKTFGSFEEAAKFLNEPERVLDLFRANSDFALRKVDAKNAVVYEFVKNVWTIATTSEAECFVEDVVEKLPYWKKEKDPRYKEYLDIMSWKKIPTGKLETISKAAVKKDLLTILNAMVLSHWIPQLTIRVEMMISVTDSKTKKTGWYSFS